jgi:hypothetical protein
MKKDDALRQKLAQTFEDFELEPNAEAWGNIRAAIQPKRKKRRFALWLWMAMLSLPIGAGLLRLGGQSLEQSLATNVVAQPELRSQALTLVARSHISALQSMRIQRRQQETTRSVANTAAAGALNTSKMQQGITTPARSNKDTGLTPATIESTKKAALPAIISVNETLVNAIDQLEWVVQELEKVPYANNAAFENPVSFLPVDSLQVFTQPISTNRALPTPIVQRARKTHTFTVAFQVLSSYQNLEAQPHPQVAARDFQTVAALDPQRLGTALSVGYRVARWKHADLGVALNWTNLPYREQYTLQNLNQVQVTVQSDNQYKMETTIVRKVNQTSRLNFIGLQLEYGYSLRLLQRPIRFYAGGQGTLLANTRQTQAWAVAGLEIPIGRSRFLLAPNVQYQLTTLDLSDHLLKARFYTLGLGLKTRF